MVDRIYSSTQYSNTELLTRMNAIHGTIPQWVLQNDELRTLSLSAFRDDLIMYASYRHVSRPPLAVKITAVVGTRDTIAPIQFVRDWEAETTAGFAVYQIEGGHMFLNSADQEVKNLVFSLATAEV